MSNEIKNTKKILIKQLKRNNMGMKLNAESPVLQL